MRATPILWVALVIATCGLVYELLAATVASWVLGDSVTQFSTIVGTYLGALGLGSYLSKHLRDDLPQRFVQIEIAIALIGGLTAPVLFLAFAHAGSFRVILYIAVIACGTLVGLEIPLLTRVLQADLAFKTVVSRVLTYDHVGSLLGSLAYSLLLAPVAGPVRTGLIFGMINAAVALWSTWLLRSQIAAVRPLRFAAALVIALLVLVLTQSSAIIDAVDPSERTPAGRAA